MKPNEVWIDCVEMKRKGQAALREATAGMSREQLIEFWRAKTEELRRCQRESLVQRPPHTRKKPA